MTTPAGTRRLPRLREIRSLLRPRPLILNGTRRRLAAAATVADLRRIARRRTPKAVFDYTDGGAGDELSIARSRAAFARVEFRPRVLRDVSTVDTTTRILGADSSLPIALAPTGFTRMMQHEGERAVVRSAAAVGVPYALSTMGTTDPESLAVAAPEARRWFQLYLWRDRDSSAELIRRAHNAGFDTLVLTVDTPVAGSRLRDVRNGMMLPPSLTAKTFLNGALRPHWWLNLLTTPPLEFASLGSWNGTVGELVNQMFDPAATFDDVARLRDEWNGKLVVKGIQCVDDARDAVAAGADAVLVSNHGGRQLDRAPVPLEQLPSIAAAVGDDAEVLMDGGIMSGADAIAALCLGANAVLVGRAYLYGLMAGGEQGVRRAIEIFAAEVRQTMQLLGVSSISELNSEHAHLRPSANPGQRG